MNHDLLFSYSRAMIKLVPKYQNRFKRNQVKYQTEILSRTTDPPKFLWTVYEMLLKWEECHGLRATNFLEKDVLL